jgi:aspartate 4-decarboxylase
MCEDILASNYPVPDRMLKLSEIIVGQYLRREMIGKYPFVGEFDLFAVEGGTAAMTYIFNSMRENHLITAGDTIALGMPIFTPYIEIPRLNDYQLNVVNVNADVENNWQYSKAELDKLRDPKVKAFFLVNPSNPPSVKISDKSLQQIADIVKERPDLILLTDDVYGTFADDFVSLFALAPKNTILVYSYSKYFGATGWRLGTIATHKDNVLDRLIAELPKDVRKELHTRYESITTEPDRLKFIDRLVADSRTVALNHTAGLSTPQQVQMVLFSLFSLMDTPDAYKNALKRLIRSRKRALYEEVGIRFEDNDPNQVDYYTILDMEFLGERAYGREFVDWLLKNTEPSELLFKLAREARVVLLPGRGFGTKHPSGRVSLANLNESDYREIGRAMRRLIEEYVERFNAATGKNLDKNKVQ